MERKREDGTFTETRISREEIDERMKRGLEKRARATEMPPLNRAQRRAAARLDRAFEAIKR